MSRLVRNVWPALMAATLCSGAALAAPPDPKEKEVVVVNGPDQAVPVRVIPADQPFHHQFALDFPDGEGLVTSTYTVPAGQRLAIEYASLSAYLPPDGQTIFVRIITTTSNGHSPTDAFHTLAIQKREDYGVLKQFEGAHAVRIYANPSTSVRVSLGRLPFTGTANGNVTLSGRLESLP